MSHLNHIPWDIVSLTIAVIILGTVLYLFLGKRIGIQVWKGASAPSSAGRKPLSVNPPPLPSNAPSSKDPTRYILPALGTEGAASLARAAERIPSFSGEKLLHEVEKVYRSVVSAYGEEDLKKLDQFLESKALEIFKTDIEGRQQRKEKLFISLSSIESMELLRIIDPPDLPGETEEDRKKLPKERVEVEISSWQVNGVKEESGHIIVGTQGLTHFCERWLFESEGDLQKWHIAAIESV